jgi:hypothetical protein
MAGSQRHAKFHFRYVRDVVQAGLASILIPAEDKALLLLFVDERQELRWL